jgi:uncharacterized protein YacL
MKIQELPFRTTQLVLYVLVAVLVVAMLALVGTVGGIVLVPFVAVPAAVLAYLGHRAGSHHHV